MFGLMKVYISLYSIGLNWNKHVGLVSSIDKVFDGCKRDLGFNPAYTKNCLVSWSDDKELLSGADAISWNSLPKKKLK